MQEKIIAHVECFFQMFLNSIAKIEIVAYVVSFSIRCNY